MTFVKAYLGTLLSFLLLDAIWITGFVRGYYEQQVGELLRATPDLWSALVFYIGYAAGIVTLVVRPSLASGGLKYALVNGAVLGAIAYGAFSLTNFSVLADWTVGLVVSDIAWGTVLTSIVAACGYLAAR